MATLDLSHASVADNASYTGSLALTSGYTISVQSSTSDYRCRIQFYRSSIERTLDAGRDILDTPEVGVIDWIGEASDNTLFPASWDYTFTPGIDIGWGNPVYWRVTNMRGIASALNITVTYSERAEHLPVNLPFGYPNIDKWPDETTVYPQHPGIDRWRNYEATVMNMGPSIYLPLDDIYGEEDLTTNHVNTGTPGGLVVGGRQGALQFQYSACAYMDGIDDEITTGYNPFQAGAERTFMGWGLRRDTANTHPLFSGNSAGSPALVLLADSGDVRWRLIGNTGGTTNSVTFSDVWGDDDEWIFWVLVVDDGADIANLWIEGEQVGAATGLSGGYSSPAALQYGVNGGHTNFLYGMLCHVAVFERRLTAFEIRRLWKAGRQGPRGDG